MYSTARPLTLTFLSFVAVLKRLQLQNAFWPSCVLILNSECGRLMQPTLTHGRRCQHQTFNQPLVAWKPKWSDGRMQAQRATNRTKRRSWRNCSEQKLKGLFRNTLSLKLVNPGGSIVWGTEELNALQSVVWHSGELSKKASSLAHGNQSCETPLLGMIYIF